jgi:hypothetical protein
LSPQPAENKVKQVGDLKCEMEYAAMERGLAAMAANDTV